VTPRDARRDCPYVGLEHFQEADREFFKGRDAAQRIVIANLRTAPLTFLYGAPAVGKSSLLLAGVLPQLHADLPKTPVVVFREWIEKDFARHLARACIEATWATGVDQPRPAESLPFDEVLRACAEAARGTILVLLDQFEDYLEYHPKSDAADSFEAQFARAVNREDVDVGFLIAIREPSLSKLDRFRERIPRLLNNTLRLEHLDMAGARAAIGQPVLDVWNAKYGGDQPVRIEDALVEQVIGEARGDLTLSERGGKGVAQGEAVIETPFLQLVMESIWHEEMRQDSRTLRLETLKRLGGAREIVRAHLEDVMMGMNESQRAACASFLDRLVTPSGTKVPCSRIDMVKWAGPVGDQVPAALALLSARRILRTVAPEPGKPEETRYEIFLDRLSPAILGWHGRYVEEQRRKRAVAEAQQQARIRARLRWAPLLAATTVVAILGWAMSYIHDKRSISNQKAAESMAAAAFDAARALDLAIDARKPRWLPPTDATEDALRLAVQASRLEWTQRLPGRVMNVAFSPDGTKVATRSYARDHSEVIVWENGGSEPVRLAERAFPDRRLLGGLAFLPSGDTLVTVASESAWLWTFGDKAAPAVELPHGLPIETALAVRRDGRRIALAGSRQDPGTGIREGSIKIWQLDPGTPRQSLTINLGDAWAMGLVFSPDGCCLAAAFVQRGRTQHTYATIWNADTGERILSLPMQVPSDAVAFGADGMSVVLAARDNWLRVLRPAVGELDQIMAKLAKQGPPKPDTTELIWNERVLAGHIERVRDVSVSPNGARIASAGADATVIVWDTQTGENLFTLTGHDAWVESVAFGPQGQRLASGSRDGTLRMWNVAGHTAGVYAIAFNPDPALPMLATASGDRTAKLWDVSSTTPRVLHRLEDHTDTVFRLAFDPRGERLATASFDKTAKLWDIRSGQLLGTFEGHSDQLRDVAFSADGDFLATSSADGTAWLYPLAEWSPTPVQVRHDGTNTVQVSAIAMHPNPNVTQWVTAGWDGVLKLWDFSGRLLGTIPRSDAYVGDPRIVRVAFNSTGTELAALIGHSVYFWPVSRFDRDDGSKPRRLEVPGAKFCDSMAFNADATQLAVACSDGAVRVFNYGAGAWSLAKTVRLHSNSVMGTAFSPDGKKLATAGLDKAFHISPLEFKALYDLARQRQAEISGLH
jgi:WD40 repeat protein